MDKVEETAEALVWYWHVHHDQLGEPLTEPIETRIAYVLSTKP